MPLAEPLFIVARRKRRRRARAEPRREPDAPSAPLPRHVGIIMDGNGRWAHAHGLPRGEGHRRGVEALRRAVRFAGAARHPLPDAVQLLLGELVAAATTRSRACSTSCASSSAATWRS